MYIEMFGITQVSDFDFQCIPANIPEALLTIENDFDSTDNIPSMSSGVHPSSNSMFAEIWKSILDKYVLSGIGRIKLQKLVQAFAVTHNKDNVVKFFTQSCCDSKSFFDDGSSITKAVASSNLLDIINIICNWNSNNADENCFASITQFEADAIEYLGGFVLHKAKSKFAFASSIVEIMMKPTPTGKLVKALEKKQGSLYYPNERFASLLNTVYLKCSRETFKPGNKIDFFNVVSAILSHAHYNSYLEEISCHEGHTLSENAVEEVLEYVVKLFVRMLSYTYAKRLFHNLFQQSTRNSKSFRQSLQASTSKS